MVIVRLAAALALAAPPVAARIVAIEVKRTEPIADGKEFGARGSYVRVVGVAKGELDQGPGGERRWQAPRRLAARPVVCPQSSRKQQRELICQPPWAKRRRVG